jgi:hypothetical protein
VYCSRACHAYRASQPRLTFEQRVEQRFWRKVDRSNPPCWLWTGSLDGNGHGAFSVRGQGIAAHRFAYRLLVGEIPENQRIDQSCQNKRCVNPEHLIVVNQGPVPRDPIERFWEKVNRTDNHWLWTGGTSGGYGIFEGNGAHRFAWELENGHIPAHLEIDHRCRTPLCVRPSHLRIVPGKQNQENRDPLSRGSSRYRGVSFRQGKWDVRVVHHGQIFRGGRFEDEDEAAEAARQLRNSLFTCNDADRGIPSP